MTHQRKFVGLASALLLGAFTAAAVAGPSDPIGTWFPSAGEAKIRVEACGSALCGSVTWQKTPRKDTLNPDPAKRDNPVVGTRILNGFKPTGSTGEWRGTVYNAEDGKTYDAYMIMQADGSMNLKGCVLGILCKSDHWTRAD